MLGLILAAYVVAGVLVDAAQATMGAAVPALLLTIASGVIGTIIAIRRLHDIGRSGWWTLLPAAVLVAMGVLTFALWPSPLALFGAGVGLLAAAGMVILLGCAPGEPGPNRFGA